MDIDTWEGLIKKLTLLKPVYEDEVSLNKEKVGSLEEVEMYMNEKYEFQSSFGESVQYQFRKNSPISNKKLSVL